MGIGCSVIGVLVAAKEMASQIGSSWRATRTEWGEPETRACGKHVKMRCFKSQERVRCVARDSGDGDCGTSGRLPPAPPTVCS